MIEGFVNANREAIVPLSLRGPEGQTREVNAVIDTGYSGALTLPPALVAGVANRLYAVIYYCRHYASWGYIDMSSAHFAGEHHDESDESMVNVQRGTPRSAASPTGGSALSGIVSRRRPAAGLRALFTPPPRPSVLS